MNVFYPLSVVIDRKKLVDNGGRELLRLELNVDLVGLGVGEQIAVRTFVRNSGQRRRIGKARPKKGASESWDGGSVDSSLVSIALSWEQARASLMNNGRL